MSDFCSFRIDSNEGLNFGFWDFETKKKNSILRRSAGENCNLQNLILKVKKMDSPDVKWVSKPM